MEKLKNGEIEPSYDMSKEDSFAIGITMLCSSLNLSINEFYDFRKLEILENKIEDALY